MIMGVIKQIIMMVMAIMIVVIMIADTIMITIDGHRRAMPMATRPIEGRGGPGHHRTASARPFGAGAGSGLRCAAEASAVSS